MALMRYYIDKRTLAALTSLDVATFAHGLNGMPDAVFVRYVATQATATNWIQVQAVYDATNVTLQNIGDGTTPALEVCTLRFHSMVQ